MIINGILTIIFNVFNVLTLPINIPTMPDGVPTAMNYFLEWLDMGLSIAAAYTHLSYLLSLFGLIVTIDIAISLYKFVMWVIRKIPMLNIS